MRATPCEFLMLKRIAADRLRVGMYVHKPCGSWLDHPFWRSAFAIDDESVLKQVRESPVREVWIDTERGLDVDDAHGALADGGDTGSAPHAGGDAAGGAPAAAATPADPAPPGDDGVALATRAPRTTAPRRASRPSDAMRAETGRALRIREQARRQIGALHQDARMGKAVETGHLMPLVADISESVERSRSALLSLMRLKSKDDYTFLHSVAVCALMVSLARQLELPEPEVREAGLAGLLHDIGKAAVPLPILNKPGRLDDAEMRIVRSHPAAGHEMLTRAGGVCAIALDVCLHHHERPDGAGYPHGLAGDALGLHARMGAVCDVYDAITSDRPYKAGWNPAQSLKLMADWTRAGQFDPRVFQAFVRCIGIYPTGTLVRLRSGRLTVVLDQHPDSLLTPTVRVFYSSRSRAYLVPEELDLASAGTSESIVAVENPSDWGITNLDEMWTGVPNRRP